MVFLRGDGNFFTSPSTQCVLLSICQFDTHTVTEKSHIHTHSPTQRSPAVNHGSVRGRKQTGYSVPWHKSLKLRPGCCRESTVCHTLQIQASLCHTQITSLSLSLSRMYVSISLCNKPSVHICMQAHMHSTHSCTLHRNNLENPVWAEQRGRSILHSDRRPAWTIPHQTCSPRPCVCVCVAQGI